MKRHIFHPNVDLTWGGGGRAERAGREGRRGGRKERIERPTAEGGEAETDTALQWMMMVIPAAYRFHPCLEVSWGETYPFSP